MKKTLLSVSYIFLMTACTLAPQKQSEKSQFHTVSTDSVHTLHGQLIMGHEAYSFTADGDTIAYWVIDKSGKLKELYEAALSPNTPPYTAIPAKLKVYFRGASSEGFAAEYAGVIEVVEILSVGK